MNHRPTTADIEADSSLRSWPAGKRSARRPPPRLLAAAIALVLPWLSPPGCADEELPPPTAATAPATVPEVDRKHSAKIQADRRIAIPNIQFVVQRDPSDPTLTGLTLWSAQPGADGSRLLFGTMQNLASLDKLTATEIRFGGARLLDPRGNGIFTKAAVYQPKFTSLRISKMTSDEVHGTISGEFYWFKAAPPGARPEVIQLEAAFDAVLVLR